MLYYLYRNPECYNKLVHEIREADATNKLSRPAKYSETVGMPYLQVNPILSVRLRMKSNSLFRNAVVNESLRIHPSTGTLLERYVPKGGVVIHGKTIPEGTTIGVNAWVMNRNKDIFGEDVEQFRPERWIDSPPEQISAMKRNMLTAGSPYHSPSSSSGTDKCLVGSRREELHRKEHGYDADSEGDYGAVSPF